MLARKRRERVKVMFSQFNNDTAAPRHLHTSDSLERQVAPRMSLEWGPIVGGKGIAPCPK
eukprot:3875930-Pyramimonas_sp.AAC.2